MRQKALGPLVAVLVGLAGSVAACRSDEQPTKPDAWTILPGIGLKECRLGGTVADAQTLFGKPAKSEGGYVLFSEQGVDLKVQDDKIQVLFFYYRDRDHKPFPAKTDKGIGPNSTMEDVQKAYGKPDRIGESVVSEFGSNPGALEHYLPYGKLGIAFTFHDRKLADIRVWTAKE